MTNYSLSQKNLQILFINTAVTVLINAVHNFRYKSSKADFSDCPKQDIFKKMEKLALPSVFA